ncbi:hypothetical protein QTP70_003299 [Hemibagrus guttatus]|uniref:ribonuclease H n=1 Tax=Hemibagrus guttatus TaxID=175788 RepID=A0AAE0VC63_9TELE|nr:hypothetical protein QTP86_004179 [Hemibagrus guttatus]KAK3548043.1 hypothetical protein QTP70_003299 [Hemibagrus guttatus]
MIRKVIEYSAGGKDISVQLIKLRQVSEATADYAIRFCTLVAQSGWNDAALWAVFRAGLNPARQTELACHVEATSVTVRGHGHPAGQPAAPASGRDPSHSRSSAPGAPTPRPDETVLQLRGLRTAESSVTGEAFVDSALIDSGAAVNLIDGALVEELGIPTFPCVPSLRITAIDSQPIGEGYLKHQTKLLEFQALQDFLHGEVTPAAHGHLPHPYADFKEVFSEEGAACLPSHQVWDCAIDLLPNTSPPKGRIYPLSLPESKAMEGYIEAALAAAHVRPSTSPAAAGFFFFGKKDGGLQRCIDYRGLNAISVQYPYPLPLTLINGVFQDLLGKGVIAYIDDILVYSSSMEEHVRLVREVLTRLQRHHLYVKLEKCEFHRTTVTFLGYVISHQGVEMDVVKVRAVTEWPAPATRLKNCFTTAPILRHPDPDLLFVVEVDGSSSGLRAVLSQRHGEPGKLHPCAFYSRKLTATEANYDVGNRELLAIKAALEECLRGAKRLNPRQARWALFFTRFLFTVTYRPRSKNGKADALSRQFEAASKPGQPDLILPATAILAPVQWDLVEEIRWAHADEPPPPAVRQPEFSCHSNSGRRLCSGCMRRPALVTQGSADLPSSSAAGSGGPPWARMWRGTSGHATRAHMCGPVVSFWRGCWSPFRFPNVPGRTCQWIS